MFRRSTRRSAGRVLLAPLALAAMLALFNLLRGRRATWRASRYARFIDLGDGPMRYLDRGAGPPVLLIHGLGALIEDFEISGLIEPLARRHRVVIIDRPGSGLSTRPRRNVSLEEQAALLWRALDRLGVTQPVLLGHSMGASIALAMALQRPTRVRGLLLLAGYYYRARRHRLLPIAVTAVPILGDALRYTVLPLLERALAPVYLAWLFAPRPVPRRMRREFPFELALRPSQLRTTGADAAALGTGIGRLARRYGALRAPVILMSGTGDRVLDPRAHTLRLHAVLPASELVLVPGVGHMLHHAVPDRVARAVERLDRRALNDSETARA